MLGMSKMFVSKATTENVKMTETEQHEWLKVRIQKLGTETSSQYPHKIVNLKSRKPGNV